MRAFLSVFRLEALSALRSKTAAVLAALAVAWIWLFPAIAHGDGSGSGTFALNVNYSAGIVFACAVVAAAASAAASLSGERASKRLPLTLVRSASRVCVALGRIAALSLVNSLSLFAAMAALVARTPSAPETFHVHAPRLEDPSAGAVRLYDEYMREYPDFREKAEKAGRRETMRYLAQYVRESLETVVPGESKSWPVDGVEPAAGGLLVRVSLANVPGRLESLSGTFRLGGLEGRLSGVSERIVAIPLRPRTDADSAGDAPQFAVGDFGSLVFENDGKAALTLNPRTGLAVLTPAGGFVANAFRAWIVMSALAAIAVSAGVFLGACLGGGVAVFCALALLAASVVSPGVMEEYPDPMEASAVDRLSLGLASLAERATSPLNAFSPVSSLADAECVEWRDVAWAAASGFVAYPLLFALLSAFALSSRPE